MDELDAGLVRDHVGGLELQLVELVERQKRAAAQGHQTDVERLQRDIEALHAELALAAEMVPSPAPSDEEAAPG